ncbi:conjugative transfer relaxase/helicase TraI [Photobacterium damselae]|uniref:IncF plasmid conjugative transfer DNA-nicking and unwinding protein TraI n=5 Tax=Photobacterium damselae TaxID=38293 RepID=D0Z5E1_PHODD|nr:conjugative transfer relaxase/helicase TraI [Photobacterium damselae]EEZ39063.1 IncF plasmid conjugative transfer DNA-nicking and unwinding protein TraI [Photobacterium damselae subsp. damselae CIP 102761]
MLSLSSLRGGASGASKYYLEEEKQLHLNQPQFTLKTDTQPTKDSPLPPTDNPTANYYLAEQSGTKKTTQWYGKIAEKEGILGHEIEHQKLEAVLNGQLNNDQTPRAHSDTRRTGYDLVFSAPKGASILALVYGDTRIIDAHNAAVKTALDLLEQDTAQAKVTENKEGRFENTQNLLFGLVQHKTNRNNEPQLHTHALQANMTYDNQGNLKNLASSFVQNGFETQGTYERILENAKYYGMAYHSELGRALEGMGFAIKSLGNGQIDIDGIPTEVIEANSTRREEILEYANETGHSSGKSRMIAAHQTRKAKTYTPEDSLVKEWQTKNEALKFDGLAFVAASYNGEHRKDNDISVPDKELQQAIDNSISYLSDRLSAFGYEKVLVTALDKFAPKAITQMGELKQALDNKIKHGDLIALDDKQSLFTTQEQVDREAKLIESTQKRTHGLRVHADSTALNELNLKADTKKTLADILASTKQVNVVNLSGSSKQLSESLLHVSENSGKSIHFITPNKLVKQQTEQQVRRQAFSVTQWVKNAFRPDVVHTAYQYLNQAERRQKTKDSILVVEHANQLGVKETQQLIDLAQRQGNKLVFLNHTKRSQGLRAGNAMDVVQKGNVQTHTWQGAQLAQTHIKTSEVDKKERHQILAERYQELSKQERSETQVLTTNKGDNDNLNRVIRHQLDKSGQLSEKRVEIPTLNPVFMSPEQQRSIKSYQKGMVISQVNDGKVQQYTVEKVNSRAQTLQLLDSDNNRSYLNVKESSTPYFVSQPDKIEVATGDRLRINGDVFRTDLKQNDTVTVEKIGWMGLSLTDDNGKGHLVPLSYLEGSALSYGYANTLNNAAHGKTTTLVEMQSYTASKETLYELMQQGSKQLHIFTDNQEKLEARMEKSHIQPSSMARVMASTQSLDKYVNAQTAETLQSDVTMAVQALLDQQAPKPLIEQAVNFALDHVSEQQAGFKHSELVVEAIRFAMDEKGTTVLESEIHNKLNELQQQDSVLSAQFSDGTRWTTKEAIDTEKRILTRLDAGKGQVASYASERQADAYLAQQDWMTDGQKEAIKLMATTNDRYTIVQGFAGVGKSTMLEQGKTLIEQTQALHGNANIDVLGLAPTHAAVNELKEKGIPAQTTQSLLKDLLTGDTTPDKYKNTLFLLDESSMASNAQFDAFTALVNNSGARATLLGDIYQLQSKEAGKPFELAYRSKSVDTVVMKDIQRQQTPELLSAVQNVINQQSESMLEAIKQQSPLPGSHHNQTVVSTYNETGNSAKDREVAKEELYQSAAAEYLSRTPESRENTLMIAYSNRERDILAGLIRKGLKEMKELLDKSDTPVTRLRGIGTTKEELKTMMPYKAGLIINTGRDTYLHIDSIDRRNELLMVTNMTTGEQTSFIPARHDHKMTTLWSSSEMPLTSGDKITWRKTDKELGLTGNMDLTVSDINKDTIMLSNNDGKHVTLSLSDMKSSHWDYRYTKTADMAQGSTTNHVISVIDSEAKLTNLRRAYIDISRASQHAMIFTDNEKGLMRSWLNHFDNNSSAIETVNKTYHSNERHFDTQSIPRENPKYQQHGEFKLSLYAKDLAQQLTPYTESLAIELLGQPNNSKSDNDYLAFGQGQSHLKVTLTGEYRGYFRDWTTGDKGNLINLIMSAKSFSFKEAVNFAEQILTEPENHNLIENEKHDKLVDTLPKQMSELKERAMSYFEQGAEIKETIANIYINNQTYHDFESHPALRFHEQVYSSETKSTHPALLAALTNNKGEIEAIEITYLNKDGDLADNLTTPKRLMGNKSGHGIVLNDGTLPDISVVAIGLENGISLLGSNTHDVDIVAVTNAHDLRTLDTKALREQIIIMASEHQLSNQNLISDITNKLTAQGHNVSIVKEAMDGLSPQDIGILISDKVNDNIAELKGEHEIDTKKIDQLVDDISKSQEFSNKEIASLLDVIEPKEITHADNVASDKIDNALSEYEHYQEQTAKELEKQIELEKELDYPSL